MPLHTVGIGGGFFAVHWDTIYIVSEIDEPIWPEYVASKVRHGARAGQAFVVAPPHWFVARDQDKPVFVTSGSPWWEKFLAFLHDDVSGEVWRAPDGMEHRYFTYDPKPSPPGDLWGVVQFAKVKSINQNSAGSMAWLRVKGSDSKMHDYFGLKPLGNSRENPTLAMRDWHKGKGPIAQLCKRVGGIRKLKDLHGVSVRLEFDEDGVCRLVE